MPSLPFRLILCWKHGDPSGSSCVGKDWRYREDTDRSRPNQAPRECWPSTSAFRTILYGAGKRLGRDAAIYLDRIPAADLRLFAQIELAAALTGLPELRGLQMESRH
jgi:hypothetical protein